MMKYDITKTEKETPLLLAMWISLGVVENSMEILLNKNKTGPPKSPAITSWSYVQSNGNP